MTKIPPLSDFPIGTPRYIPFVHGLAEEVANAVGADPQIVFEFKDRVMKVYAEVPAGTSTVEAEALGWALENPPGNLLEDCENEPDPSSRWMGKSINVRYDEPDQGETPP